MYLTYAYHRSEFSGIMTVNKCLRYILTEGLVPTARDRDHATTKSLKTQPQPQPQQPNSSLVSISKRISTLIDPKLILDTIHRLDGDGPWRFLLNQFQEHTLHLTNGKILFQHVVNFVLVQAYRHLEMIKVLTQTFHANPNVLVPVREDALRGWIVDCSILNTQYHQCLQGDDQIDPNTLHEEEETWNIGQWSDNGQQIQGYSILHLNAISSSPAGEKRTAYLVQHAPIRADPFKDSYELNTDDLAQTLHDITGTPIDIAFRHYHEKVSAFYLHEVFPSCVNDLVLMDRKYQPHRRITPLMFIANRKHYCGMDVDDSEHHGLQFLIQRCNADVNMRDSAGETVLMRAIRSNRAYVVKHLLELSADHDCWEEIEMAMVKDNPRIFNLIREYWPAVWKKRPFDA
jgi:hypothetical protein